MKEVTYEDWQKNPTPRMMWVWNDDEDAAEQEKVIFIKSGGTDPVIAITYNDLYIILFKHCAEIEEPKTRRMTHKELARWLREKPTRECKWTFDDCIYGVYGYGEKYADEEVNKDIRIREDDGEWQEPFVEESIMFEKEAEDFLKKSLKVDDDEFDFFKNEASCKEEIKRLTDFIEPREKRIAELEKENAELKSELSTLKTSDC